MAERPKGKMIKFDGAENKLDAYLCRPDEDGIHPGVIVIHEIWGLNDHIKDVADRFAAQGYTALAPHLFSSSSVPSGLTEENIRTAMQFFMSIPPDRQRDQQYVQAELSKQPEERRKVISSLMGIIFNLPTEKLTEELTYAAKYMRHNREVAVSRIGSVGFCFGGNMSVNLACTGSTDACVIFYGSNPSPIDGVKNIKGGVLGIYGGSDKRINAGLPELVRAMVDYEKDFEMRIYPGCPHAFFNDTSPANYRKKQAEDAWEQVLRFFKRTIGE